MTDELLEFNKKYPLKRITIENKQWEYLTQGKGKTAFLIFPGGGQYAQSLFMMADSFGNEYKVIIPTVYDIYSIDEFCRAINIILKHEGVNKLILYGLSVGALLAQSYTIRNQARVLALIISHGAAPNSFTYKRKVIFPLRLLSIVLPIVPAFLIRYIAKHFAGRIQGISKKLTKQFPKPNLGKQTEKRYILEKLLAKKFYEEYLNKTLLSTWIKLHFDFHKNEKLSSNDFKHLQKNILILRTDNDPLMQDDGEFNKIYPFATVHSFIGTGHLTATYQYDAMVKVIKEFLDNKLANKRRLI